MIACDSTKYKVLSIAAVVDCRKMLSTLQSNACEKIISFICINDIQGFRIVIHELGGLGKDLHNFISPLTQK